jgi:hypothetical protein
MAAGDARAAALEVVPGLSGAARLKMKRLHEARKKTMQ